MDKETIKVWTHVRIACDALQHACELLQTTDAVISNDDFHLLLSAQEILDSILQSLKGEK